MPTDTAAQARKTITGNMKGERTELQRQLRDARKTEKEVAKRQKQAGDRYWTLAKKNGLDNEPNEKEREAARASDLATNAYLGITRKIELLQRKLAALDDPGELERRVQDEERKLNGLAQLHERKAATKTTTEEDDMPGGTNMTAKAAAIELLQKAGKPMPVKEVTEKAAARAGLRGKTPAATVAALIYTAAKQGHTFRIPKRGVVALAPGQPKAPASRKLKNRAPAPIRKVQAAARKTGSVEKVAARAARPLSKTAQARGTSRGGTGSRKKKTAARKR